MLISSSSSWSESTIRSSGAATATFRFSFGCGAQKREVGLVVPAKFTAVTKELRVATIPSAEILKIKTKYTHFELSFAKFKIVKQPMLK